MPNRQRGPLILAIVITVAVAALLLITMRGAAGGADAEICQARVRHLGQAVGFWVGEYGGAAFPPIVNPAPGAAWQPQRSGSAALVLADYLGHAVTRQHSDEDDAAFLARLRAVEDTVCPITGLEFWYNPALATLAPAKVLAGAPAEVEYFRCQPGADGRWPYRDHGAAGGYAVAATAGDGPTTASDVAKLRAQLEALEAKAARQPDAHLDQQLGDLRRRIDALAAQDRQAAGTQRRLQGTVRFVAGGQ